MWVNVDEDSRLSGTWAKAQALKDELFRRAGIGELTGEQADAEAVRLGLGSLSRRPNPEKFKPEAETHWTIPMAVAWIAYLDLDEVREWSAPYRSECFDWRWQCWRVGFDGPVHEGWHLEQRHKPTLSLLSLSSIYDDVADERKPAMPVKDAREALWVALREGFFAATGIDTESGRRVEIPSLEWHELVPVEAKGESDEVRRGLLGSGYREVLLPTKPLQGFWRRPAPRERLTLPPIMPPTGFGYMPLFCAAQWIATEGGTVDIDPVDVEVWQAPFADLLSAIASGAVKVVGVNGHETQPVPAHLFIGIQVDHPYADSSIEMILSEELVLRSYPYVDDEHWRKGFDDALVSRGGDRWTRLTVERADIGRLWPFAAKPETSTGLPGRPSKARHLIGDEMLRRAEESRLATSLAQEAKALLGWLTISHPTVARPAQRTIANNIRGDYRRLKGTK